MKVHPSSSKPINLLKRIDAEKDDTQICFRQLGTGEAMDRLNVMKKLEETTYSSQQYFPHWKKYQNEKQKFMRIALQDKSSLTIVESTSIKSNDLNEYYRSIMCEWGYQLIDFFEADREVVAVAFSYLDRLLEHFVCNKKVFRLATVTSIYLAVNLICCKELPIKNLVDLCQYEFHVQNFIDMKLIILRTLSWKLHPPTSKSFLDHLSLFLLPDVKLSAKEKMMQRSSFLVELSISDSLFIGKKSSHIALAAMLNAVEELSNDEFDEISRSVFIHHLSRALEISPQSTVINNYKKRLIELYKRSKQFEKDFDEDNTATFYVHKDKSRSKNNHEVAVTSSKTASFNGCMNMISRGKLWNSFQNSAIWK